MAPPPARRHLLVVDDEPHIGLLLRPHLEELGYRVSLARSLGEARAAAPYDGILVAAAAPSIPPALVRALRLFHAREPARADHS